MRSARRIPQQVLLNLILTLNPDPSNLLKSVDFELRDSGDWDVYELRL